MEKHKYRILATKYLQDTIHYELYCDECERQVDLFIALENGKPKCYEFEKNTVIEGSPCFHSIHIAVHYNHNKAPQNITFSETPVSADEPDNTLGIPLEIECLSKSSRSSNTVLLPPDEVPVTFQKFINNLPFWDEADDES